MFFYALFPVLLVAAVRMPAAWRVRAIAGLAVVALLLPVAARTLLADDTAAWFAHVFPPTRLIEFAVGVLLALEVAGRRLPRIPVTAATGIVVVTMAVLWQAPTLLQPAAIPLIPFALLIVACAQRDGEGRRSLFRAPWLVRLGEWSFAFYLLHELVLRAGANVVDLDELSAAAKIGGAALALLVGVAASALLHNLVERPAERRLRGRTADVVMGPASRTIRRGGSEAGDRPSPAVAP
jgi:peptidoglycan/LPS O-acetylase OafA/YrhL